MVETLNGEWNRTIGLLGEVGLLGVGTVALLEE